MTTQNSDDDDDVDVPEHEYATRDEATAAIASLTDDEHLRLMTLARIHWRQRRLREVMLPEELLNEAVVRTLTTGRRPRRWRKAVVTMIEHLDRSMESISGHAVGDVVAEGELLDAIRSEEIDRRTSAPRRFHRAVAQDQLLAREELQAIEELFAGAPRALAFLRLRAEGYTESEIMKRLGIEKRAYEAARKKAERVVAQYALRSERETKHEE
ncbi:MAG TPA: hypothetical protein VF057_02130 [Thermoanaerobaculia bacterium]